MIAIIDYGAGNLFSVKNAVDFIQKESIITNKIEQIEKCDKIILPGVGAFPDAIEKLKSVKLFDYLKNQSKPILGICLGMQMLFEKSYEFCECEGLGLIKGYVDKIPVSKGKEKEFKIPHMGFNNLILNNKSEIFDDETAQKYVYFVHSYRAFCDEENIVAYCEYESKVPALVQNGNVYGCQFHPEKSGDVGIEILRKFCEIGG